MECPHCPPENIAPEGFFINFGDEEEGEGPYPSEPSHGLPSSGSQILAPGEYSGIEAGSRVGAEWTITITPEGLTPVTSLQVTVSLATRALL